MRGRYIAFEGGDGVGKSTQAARLAEVLGAVLTREPGGTEIGRALRAVVLDPARHELVPRAEALLYAADRAQHAAEVVEAALGGGRHVVSDRSAWSSVVYQGDARDLGADAVWRLCDWAIDGHWPDLVVLLDCEPSEARQRLDGALDRIEGAGETFHRHVREGYLARAQADPLGWVVVDGAAPPDEVSAKVRAGVRERLGL